MTEFTGERVIPGAVNDDLWAEHVARYAFAESFAEGRRVLDAGCGTGYGAAHLAIVASSVVGIDIAPEAIEYAHANFPGPGLRFLISDCGALPFPNTAFDVVVAFELIEHLQDYRALLVECARVVTPEGLVIVSSPNRLYYADSRAGAGPNPYHIHEFDPPEFEAELRRVFPNVRMFLQDRVEAFAFHAAASFWPVEAHIAGLGGKDHAHFLVGVCSPGPLPDPRSFVYVPKAANLLREREHHIQLLEKSLAEIRTDRDALLALYHQKLEELEERGKWALQLTAELTERGQRIVQLQDEFAAQQRAAVEMAQAYESQVRQLEEESRERLEWGLATEARLTGELQAKSAELVETVRLLDRAEETVVERTLWAQRTEQERQNLEAKLNLIRTSRWVRLGRAIRLGPVIDPS